MSRGSQRQKRLMWRDLSFRGVSSITEVEASHRETFGMGPAEDRQRMERRAQRLERSAGWSETDARWLKGPPQWMEPDERRLEGDAMWTTPGERQ